MKEFVLIFRMDILSSGAQPSKEQMAVYMQQWSEWINSIADKGQLAEGGNHLSTHGRVLKPGGVMDEGPYESNGCSVAGYIIVLAKSIDGATKIAERCPILLGENTSVEIREVGA